MTVRQTDLEGAVSVLPKLREVLRPTNPADAAALIQHPGVRVLAGGTELTGGGPDWEIEALVDLAGLGLDHIDSGADGWRIGAMVTLAELEAEASLAMLPGQILSRAARASAPRTLRQAATLGGTLVGALGGWEVPTTLLALGAQVSLFSGTHPLEISLAELVKHKGMFFPGSLVTGVRIPPPAVGARGALVRIARTPADAAIAVAAAVWEQRCPRAGEGPVGEARIAVGGLAPSPVLLQAAANLAGKDLQAPAVHEAAAEAVALVDLSDVRASAEYRRWVAPVLVQRVLEEAWA